MYIAATYGREEDGVWRAKLRVYAATVHATRKMYDRMNRATARTIAVADYSRAH